MARSQTSKGTLGEFCLEAPYSDRQKIVVVPDQVAEADRETRTEADSAGPSKPDDVVKEVFKNLALPGYATLTAARAVVKAVARLREKGLDVWLVGRGELPAGMLPAGHPLDDVLYVGHPADPNLYYPTAEFHRRVFEHKFCEALELMAGLGATRVKVDQLETGTKIEARSLDVPLAATQRLGAKLKRRKESSSTASFTGSFRGSSEPKVPDDLVWFSSERTWQSLARLRMEAGATEFGLTLRYDSNYGVDNDLKGTIEGVGLSVGGEFSEQRRTLWRIEGEFPPIPASPAGRPPSGVLATTGAAAA